MPQELFRMILSPCFTLHQLICSHCKQGRHHMTMAHDTPSMAREIGVLVLATSRLDKKSDDERPRVARRRDIS